MEEIKPIAQRKFSNRTLAFILALIYTVVGNGFTWWGMSLGANNFIQQVSFFVFLPCNYLTLMVLFVTENHPVILLLASQAIVLLIMWGIIYLVLFLFRLNKK